MTIRLHRGDLPDLSAYKGAVAIDTEAMGLDLIAIGFASCNCRLEMALRTWQIAPGNGRRPISSGCCRTNRSSKSFISRASIWGYWRKHSA